MLQAFVLQGNRQRLDGGAMFGNAPRVVWEKWCKPDEQGRIELACRTLLIEQAGKRILLEAGIGAFFKPELRERYGVLSKEHELLSSLSKLGLTRESVDCVVLSHLHFDHAGGLLEAFREGAEPRLVFPNAEFIVSRRAYERARQPHERDRASFIPPLQDLLRDSGRLRLVDTLEDFQTLLGPSFSYRQSDGHTPGMLHTQVSGQKARLLFGADLVPGVPWVHVPITMGYDRFPEQLIDEKSELFSKLIESDTHLYFTHDAAFSCTRLSRNAQGRYSAAAPHADWQGAWDLDELAAPQGTASA